jgi:hypothetical protein
MMKRLLPPQIAYFVSLDAIIPLEVDYTYTTKTHNASFLTKRAKYLKPGAIQYPSATSHAFMTADPSSNGNPFEHPFVRWDYEEAVELYKERQLYQAKFYREQAERHLKTAKELEATDYYQLILGKPDPTTIYISPFTGKTT